MIKTLNLCCFLLLAIIVNANHSISFQEIDFKTLQIEAQKKNKVFFVFFYGNRCVPCEMMKENTFNNPNIIQKVNKDFIAAKVELNSQLGLDWQMNIESTVQYIPTIVFFTPQGKMIGKYEEWLVPSKFQQILNENLNVGKGIAYTKRPPTKSKKTYQASFKSQQKKTKKSNSIKAERITKSSRQMVIEIKSFNSLYGVDDYVNRIQKQTNRKNIRYIIDETGKTTKYRVIAGKYNSAVAANRVIQELKKVNVDAILRQL